ncbi:MAG: hypothetical protein RR263_05875, partial [Oscillospiraceae bacterium]
MATAPVDAFAQEAPPATPRTAIETAEVADSGTPGEPAGTEGNHNADCPLCKDGLAKCAFAAPAVAMETRSTGKTIYCGTPTGGQLGNGLTPQTPVPSLKYAAELAEGGT